MRCIHGWLIATGMILLSVGCQTDPRDIVDYSKEPIPMQLLRAEPSLRGRKFNTLLSFETADDTVFVTSNPAAEQNPGRAHTGRASARVGSTGTINIASVMMGRPFPGDW